MIEKKLTQQVIKKTMTFKGVVQLKVCNNNFFLAIENDKVSVSLAVNEL